MPRSLSLVASLCLLAALGTLVPRSARGASVVAGAPESTAIDKPGRLVPRVPARAAAVGPARAFQLGLVCTVAPVALGALYASRDGGGPTQWGTLGGAVVGATLGPAVGLLAGGRDDLAYRGLFLRGMLVGVAGGLVAASWDQGTGSTASNAAIGGGTLLLLSAAYDLARTAPAVAEGQRARAALTVRPDGALAVRVTF